MDMATPLLSPAPLQVDAIRADFPILNQANERGQRLVYLDGI